jgi:hypothetical protein
MAGEGLMTRDSRCSRAALTSRWHRDDIPEDVSPLLLLQFTFSISKASSSKDMGLFFTIFGGLFLTSGDRPYKCDV